MILFGCKLLLPVVWLRLSGLAQGEKFFRVNAFQNFDWRAHLVVSMWLCHMEHLEVNQMIAVFVKT